MGPCEDSIEPWKDVFTCTKQRDMIIDVYTTHCKVNTQDNEQLR